MSDIIKDREEDVIDPTSWTTKELVKHLYRELKEVHSNQMAYKSEMQDIKDGLRDIKLELSEERSIRKERERSREEEVERQKMRMRAYVAVASVVGGILTTLISFLLGV